MISRPAALLLPILLLAACDAGAPGPSPSPTPSTEGFYLRAWTSQALPPEFTFTRLPTVTISDGLLISGNVAVPAIFPGPLLISPIVRGISDQGQAQVIARATELGLIGERTDFTAGQPMPGAELANIELVIDGTSRILLGDPSAIVRCGERCVPGPATPEAFALFWQQLGEVEAWLASELGPTASYIPLRVAVAAIEPQPTDLAPNRVAWPLEGTFVDFAQAWAQPNSRCATVEGEELDALLSALLAANQLTLFVDAANDERSLIARVVVPGEPDPCAE